MSNEIVLQVKSIPATITSNMAQLKRQLDDELAQHKQVPVSVDTLTDAKKSLADLRKVKDAFESKRKSIKAEIAQPYEDFRVEYEAALQSLTDLIKSTATQIKTVEDAQLLEKRNAIQEILNERFGMQSDSVNEFAKCPWIWLKTWELKGTKLPQVEKDVDELIGMINDALTLVAKDPAHTSQLVERFRQYGSISDLIRYQDDLKSQDFRAQRCVSQAPQQQAEQVQQQQPPEQAQPIQETTAPQAPAEDDPVYTIHIDHPQDEKAQRMIEYTVKITAPVYIVGSLARELRARGCKWERVSVKNLDK